MAQRSGKRAARKESRQHGTNVMGVGVHVPEDGARWGARAMEWNDPGPRSQATPCFPKEIRHAVNPYALTFQLFVPNYFSARCQYRRHYIIGQELLVTLPRPVKL